jgi:hypothetical protein
MISKLNTFIIVALAISTSNPFNFQFNFRILIFYLFFFLYKKVFNVAHCQSLVKSAAAIRCFSGDSSDYNFNTISITGACYVINHLFIRSSFIQNNLF